MIVAPTILTRHFTFIVSYRIQVMNRWLRVMSANRIDGVTAVGVAISTLCSSRRRRRRRRRPGHRPPRTTREWTVGTAALMSDDNAPMTAAHGSRLHRRGDPTFPPGHLPPPPLKTATVYIFTHLGLGFGVKVGLLHVVLLFWQEDFE